MRVTFFGGPADGEVAEVPEMVGASAWMLGREHQVAGDTVGYSLYVVEAADNTARLHQYLTRQPEH